MLAELGVLPPRENDQTHMIKHHLSFFSTTIVSEYAFDLQKINSSQATVIHVLKTLIELENFLRFFTKDSLLQATPPIILQFFDHKNELLASVYNKRKIYLEVRRFYDWAITKNHIVINPMPNIEPSRAKGKLLVCTDEQLIQFKNYIRHKDSDAESAMLLVLILFFGFTTRQLAQSQLIIQNDRVNIKIFRRELTKGKKYYQREELLKLPENPKWFLDLQKRFVAYWKREFLEVTKTFPISPLILPKSRIYNRYLNSDTINKKIQKATLAATGKKISNRILRQTCGHIYSQKTDTAILATLGWSEQFAFHYTWLPRTYLND